MSFRRSLALAGQILVGMVAAADQAAVPVGSEADGALPPGDCATAPLRSTGAVFYYCDCQTGADPACVPGNDANRGTSPAAPRRSFAGAEARFNSMNAGDTVALCRGGAWNANAGGIRNQRCSASKPSTFCDFRDYVPPWGSVATARPRINAGRKHAFPIWHSDRSYEGYRFWNLDVRQEDRRYDGARAFFILGKQSHIDICNVSTEGGGIGIDAAAGADHLTVRHSTFTRHGQLAIGASGPFLTLDSNTFIDNGDQAVSEERQGWMHSVYLSCREPCPGVRIVNNYFRTDPDGAWGTGNPKSRCRGVMLILRAYPTGVLVENNLFIGSAPYACGAFSISGSSGYTEARGAVIRRNRVIWTVNPTQALQIDACQSCVVTDNVIDSPGGRGISSPAEAHADKAEFSETTGTVVRNNSIRMQGGIGISVGKYAEGKDFIVENNAVWVAPGGSCFAVNRPTAGGHPFDLRTDGNYCSNDGSSPRRMWLDPMNHNYKPANPGPLVGRANQNHHSPTAIGSIPWKPTDRGIVRVPPVDAGAYQR